MEYPQLQLASAVMGGWLTPYHYISHTGVTHPGLDAGGNAREPFTPSWPGSLAPTFSLYSTSVSVDTSPHIPRHFIKTLLAGAWARRHMDVWSSSSFKMSSPGPYLSMSQFLLNPPPSSETRDQIKVPECHWSKLAIWLWNAEDGATDTTSLGEVVSALSACAASNHRISHQCHSLCCLYRQINNFLPAVWIPAEMVITTP